MNTTAKKTDKVVADYLSEMLQVVKARQEDEGSGMVQRAVEQVTYRAFLGAPPTGADDDGREAKVVNTPKT